MDMRFVSDEWHAAVAAGLPADVSTSVELVQGYGHNIQYNLTGTLPDGTQILNVKELFQLSAGRTYDTMIVSKAAKFGYVGFATIYSYGMALYGRDVLGFDVQCVRAGCANGARHWALFGWEMYDEKSVPKQWRDERARFFKRVSERLETLRPVLNDDDYLRTKSILADCRTNVRGLWDIVDNDVLMCRNALTAIGYENLPIDKPEKPLWLSECLLYVLQYPARFRLQEDGPHWSRAQTVAQNAMAHNAVQFERRLIAV